MVFFPCFLAMRTRFRSMAFFNFSLEVEEVFAVFFEFPNEDGLFGGVSNENFKKPSYAFLDITSCYFYDNSMSNSKQGIN